LPFKLKIFNREGGFYSIFFMKKQLVVGQLCINLMSAFLQETHRCRSHLK
jgi:hypothetical protein